MSGRVGLRPLGLALAAGFGAAALSGRAELLVRPWFVPVLLATAVAVGIVAAQARRMAVSPLAGFALLLPLAIGVTLTPAVVGRASQGAADPATLTSRIGDTANPLLAGRGGPVTLLQILLAEKQAGGVALAGRAVTVDAIVAAPHRLTRSVIVCCAADAQSVSLDETGPTLPHHGAWVRVTGRLATDGYRTVLVATSVRPIPVPSNPFL